MKINVIISTRNRSGSLKNTLESLISQHQNSQFTFNVIVVDNGSSDKTKDIVHKIAEKNPDKVEYRYEEKKGREIAINTGLHAADGDILIFTDDDITFDPHWIETIAQNFKDSSMHCVTGKIIPVSDQPYPSWFSEKIRTLVADVDFGKERKTVLYATGANTAIRKETFMKLGGFDHYPHVIGEDMFLSQKISNAGITIWYDPKMIIYHHFQKNRLNTSYARERYFESGKTMAELHRVEDAHDPHQFLNIPFWRYRRCLEHTWGMIKNFFNPAEWFYHELQIHRFFGLCYQRWFGKTAPDKKKMAFIASEVLPIPPVKGGAVEKCTYEIAKHLSHQNHRIAVFSLNDPELCTWKFQDQIHYHLYKKGLLGKILLCTYKLPFKKETSVFYYLPYVFWCTWRIMRARIQIVHIMSRPQFVPILRLLNPKAKIVVHVHNRSVVERGGRLWNKKLFDQMDSIICCSHSLKEEILALYPYLRDKITVIYNGVDTQTFSIENIPPVKISEIKSRYRIGPEDQVLLFTGRLVEYKGVHLLIEAFKKLTPEFPRLRLLILGGVTYSRNEETEYIRQLKALAQGMEDRVVFTGYVAHEEIPNFIAACDVFVVPSLWAEPFGVVNIEAMSMGKPVVAFARGGIKEIITHRHDGILLPEASVDALTEALVELLRNPDLCRQLGQNARATIESRFAWPHIVDTVFQEYQRLENTKQNPCLALAS